MTQKFFNQYEDENPELNMTPLLDVLFVLLILFILVAPLLQIDRVQLVTALEESKTLKTANFQTQSELIIEVDKNNQIRVNNKNIKLTDLKQHIESLKIPKQTTPILLQDKKSDFGTYETIKQTLESLDFKQLDIILKS